MRTPTSQVAGSLMTEACPRQASLPSRACQSLWRLQSAALIVITVMTFFPGWSHIQEYVFFTFLAIGLATAYAEGRSLRFSTPLHLPILLLLGWILLSVAVATDPAYSFSEWRKLAAKVLLFYWTVTVWQVALKDRRDNLDGKVLAAVAIGSLGICLYGLTDFVQRGGTWTDRPVRAGAPDSDYQWLSTYMVMSLPLLLAGAWSASQMWKRAAYGLVAVLAVIAQALSYTRAGWLGVMAQGLSFGLFTKHFRLISGVLVGFLVTVALLAGLGVAGYQRDTLDPWTLKARIAVWDLMADEIAAHPFLGVGYGTKTFMVRLGQHPETLKAGGSHNLFLMVAMGSGIPAVVFLIWVLVAGLTECLRLAWIHAGDAATWALLMAIALMIVGFSVRNLFDAMFAGSVACLFWILVGTAVAHRASSPAPIGGRATLGSVNFALADTAYPRHP
jgi:putative inorganic carbon (HCO3(-)) transporter